MNLEKNKEDDLFLEFLNSNPGARQLYNLVLQQDHNNANNPSTPRGSMGSVGARSSVVPSKSPSKSARILPIGKSPSRSNSTTVLGKSPAKQQQNIAIGKSPKKSISSANLKPITPNNRKSWTKLDTSLDLRSGETQNIIFDANANSSIGSTVPSTTPTKSDRSGVDASILSDLGSAGPNRRLSLKNQLYTPISKSTEEQKENDMNRLNFSATQSSKANPKLLDNVKPVENSKFEPKKEKASLLQFKSNTHTWNCSRQMCNCHFFYYSANNYMPRIVRIPEIQPNALCLSHKHDFHHHPCN